jgi:ribosomal protein L37E
MINDLKAFIEGLSDEEKEELKWLLKTLERKFEEENKYIVCQSCGHQMYKIDNVYQCENCGYVQAKEDE